MADDQGRFYPGLFHRIGGSGWAELSKKAYNLLNEMALSGIPIGKDVNYWIYKIANTDIAHLLHVLKKIPIYRLFEHKAVIIILRDILLPAIGEQEFFNTFFSLIINQKDPYQVVSILIKGEISTYWKLRLVESVDNNDFRHMILKSYILMSSDWKESHRLLEKAVELVSENELPRIYSLWAKVVVFNDIQDMFPQALEYCKKALQLQQKAELTYTGKLYIWISLRQLQLNGYPADVQDILNEIMEVYGFSRKFMIRFLIKEIWKKMPSTKLELMKRDILSATEAMVLQEKKSPPLSL